MGFLTKTFHVPKFLFQIPFFHNHGFSFTPLNIPITCFITFKIERSHQTHGTFDPFPVCVCSRVCLSFFQRLLDKIGRKSEITVCCGRITLKPQHVRTGWNETSWNASPFLHTKALNWYGKVILTSTWTNMDMTWTCTRWTKLPSTHNKSPKTA